MAILTTNFSVTLIVTLTCILVILGMVWITIRRDKKDHRLIYYLESGDPDIKDYRESVPGGSRYFISNSGDRIDTDAHPDLFRFRDLKENKDYLVQRWNPSVTLYLEEGKSRVIVFEIIQPNDPIHESPVFLPCLRTVETIIQDKIDDPLKGYKKTVLGVTWGSGKRKIVESEYIFGVVLYEGVQN